MIRCHYCDHECRTLTVHKRHMRRNHPLVTDVEG